MRYFEGSIIKKKNITFKQSNLLDFRMGGHPILLPIEYEFTDNEIYYFTISSQIHHLASDPDRYYLLKNIPGSGLKVPSIVDLKYVYKSSKENVPEMGVLPTHLNKAILDKFLSYLGISKDVECEELIKLVS
jgi:hypothetical protein